MFLLWVCLEHSSLAFLTPYTPTKGSLQPIKQFSSSLQFDDTTVEEHDDDDDEVHSTLQPHNDTFLYQSAGDGDPLSVKSFIMDLRNLAEEDPQRAQDALEIMVDLYRQQPDSPWTIPPDVSCYLAVMEGWIDAGDFEKAQAVLYQMEDQFLSHKDANRMLKFNETSIAVEMIYVTMIQAWVRDVRHDFSGKSAQKAEDMLRRMEDRIGSASVKLWTMVLEGWCERAGMFREAMTRARTLLEEMEHREDIPPNVLTYTSLIGGYARSKEKDKGKMAERVLERMVQRGVQPDMVAFTSVIHCWSKAVSRREREVAASRALRLISEMERLYLSKDMYHVKPSLITYTTVISAIGNSLDPMAPKLAENVMKRMYTLQESGAIANMKPNTNTYNAVIHALSKAASGNQVKYAQRAEQILYEMMKRAEQGEHDITPNVRTWAAVLRAWARCGAPDAAENTQRVLEQMEAFYDKGETDARPNYVCFTTVMSAWSNSKHPDALEYMENILKRMEQAYEETLEPDTRPNTISYVTAIDAFVRKSEKDAAQRAQATVDRMVKLYAKGLGHVRPTRVVFNTLIHAWSKSKVNGAASKAEEIFKWMERKYREGDDLVRPDEVTLCAVLNAWANQAQQGGAERAEQIWDHTKSLSIEERGFPLTIMMPNIVIKAISRSKNPNSAKKSEDILLKLDEAYRSGKSSLRPDVTTYSSVINACAYYSGSIDGRVEALEIALRTFYKFYENEGDERHNNITFGTILKAIANLMQVGEEREVLVRDLFDKCTEEGVVDSFVLSQVRYASPQLYRELVDEPCGLGGPNADDSIRSILKHIPPEWSANVVDY